MVNEYIENKNTRMITEHKNEVDIALLKQRVDSHDKLLMELSELKDNVAIIVDKLKDFKPNCPLHDFRMGEFDKRLINVEKNTEGINKKVLIWSGGFAVIIFIIANLVFPYILQHSGHTNSQNIDYIQK